MTAQARLLGSRYQVGELLGYGGMAEVHKGRDLRLGRDVAIKMLRTDLARDATFQERFRREAQNAAALNHPAIVAVYDTGEEISSTGEKLPFIVMEFVNGQTLKEELAAEQRLPPRRALEFIADICAALEFSHRHGIIHRDIKPGNVMLTQTGQIKVMDFGIARALASGATTMTQTSAVIGTAQYLSPEQARGEAVDARSDVYAAGCVLFELLIGHPPFVGDSPVSVAYQHVREDPRTPSDVNPQIPPDVDAIVLKALAKNPLNRYQSAQEMRADALRAVAGRPVLATPVMNEAETMALAGPPRYQTNGTRQIPAAMAPRQAERSSSWLMAVLAGLGVLAAVALVVGLILVNRDNQSKAPTTVSMPSLIGKSAKDAQQAVADAKLTEITVLPASQDKNCLDKVSKGQVWKQEPDANTPIELNGTGSYQVCAGPNQIEVPQNLIGSPFDNAKATIEDAGLNAVRVERDGLRSKGKDVVLELDPPAGTPLEKGARVQVIVSKGNLALVPDVTRVSRDEAVNTLRAAGFAPVIKNGSPANADDEPTVEAQSPRGGNGQTLVLGSKVFITVTVPQPDAPDPSESPSGGGTPSPSAGSTGGNGASDNGEDNGQGRDANGRSIGDIFG